MSDSKTQAANGTTTAIPAPASLNLLTLEDSLGDRHCRSGLFSRENSLGGGRQSSSPADSPRRTSHQGPELPEGGQDGEFDGHGQDNATDIAYAEGQRDAFKGMCAQFFAENRRLNKLMRKGSDIPAFVALQGRLAAAEQELSTYRIAADKRYQTLVTESEQKAAQLEERLRTAERLAEERQAGIVERDHRFAQADSAHAVYKQAAGERIAALEKRDHEAQQAIARHVQEFAAMKQLRDSAYTEIRQLRERLQLAELTQGGRRESKADQAGNGQVQLYPAVLPRAVSVYGQGSNDRKDSQTAVRRQPDPASNDRVVAEVLHQAQLAGVEGYVDRAVAAPQSRR
jgi:hypothetical protein